MTTLQVQRAPAPLDRRFEAVVIVGALDGAGPAVERLRLAGVDVTTVPAGPADRLGEALREQLARLWEAGIGRPSVLVLAGGLGRAADDVDPLLDPDLAPVTVASVDPDAGRLPSGVVGVDGGPAGVGPLLEDLLRRRHAGGVPAAVADEGWGLAFEGFDVERARVDQALLALADGRLGSSGAPLLAAPGVERWVVAGNLYTDQGPETRLVTLPAAFHLPGGLPAGARLARLLDLRAGVVHEEVFTAGGSLHSIRFSSLARPGTVVLRAAWTGERPEGPALVAPEDDPALDEGAEGDAAWMRVRADGGGAATAAVEVRRSGDGYAGLDRVAATEADPLALPEPGPATALARGAMAAGFDALLDEHRRAWAARWADADVVVEGDDRLQRATRFALFHLMACAPDGGEAAVGARGLTGQSYRGHVFWDADTFVLPFLAATHPASARAMLEYRLRRLPAALDAARTLGLAGARFPWESARSGRDVTPTSARDRSGRLVPIRTGQLEEHIVAQVAWASSCYTDWTGDAEFAGGPGLRLLVETARYWASRARLEPDGRAHVYGVIGPDEYHEPVDDNAFTNVMARWNLRRAADAVETAPVLPGVTDAELVRWRLLADALVDGWDPDTGIYEQFAGFGRLEPLVIAEVAPRRPIAADLLLGAERVRQAQVLKQADVLMLHHLVPDEVVPGTLEPNLRYYEPRTAHGSSLSPSIHAALFARARDFGPALQALDVASRIDLDDLTGTTSGGLHLATMGGLWQAFAYGFAGLRPSDGRLSLDPRLPRAWSALELHVRFRGRRVAVRTERGRVTVTADAPVGVSLDGHPYTAGPRGLRFRRAGPNWELTP